MARRDQEEIQDLLAQSRETIATLMRLTTRLEMFTDQLESDLDKQRDGGEHDGSGGADRAGGRR